MCLAFCGDGSTSRGDFHESLSIASVQKLPNVFVIENNQYSYSTPLRLTSNSSRSRTRRWPTASRGTRSTALTCWPCARRWTRRCSGPGHGEGPSIVEGVTMRMHGHAEHDPADYVVKELYEEYSKKDPVELFENVLLEAGVLDAERAARIRQDARQQAIAARRKALADPMPEPSDIEEGVYAP